jgi:hypothetical protein
VTCLPHIDAGTEVCIKSVAKLLALRFVYVTNVVHGDVTCVSIELKETGNTNLTVIRVKQRNPRRHLTTETKPIALIHTLYL